MVTNRRLLTKLSVIKEVLDDVNKQFQTAKEYHDPQMDSETFSDDLSTNLDSLLNQLEAVEKEFKKFNFETD